MESMANGDDLGQLREKFPSWRIVTHWYTAGSGPDVRTLYASRGTVTVSGRTAEDLAGKIRQAEAK